MAYRMDVEGPHNALRIRNIALKKACNSGLTFKDTQGHHNYCYKISRIQVSLLASGLLLEHLYLTLFPRY